MRGSRATLVVRGGELGQGVTLEFQLFDSGRDSHTLRPFSNERQIHSNPALLAHDDSEGLAIAITGNI